MPPSARDLLRRTGIGTRFVLTTVVTGALLVAMLSVSTVFATRSALDAAPRLPDPAVDVARIDDLSDAVNRQRSEASVVLDADGEVIGRFQPEELHLPLETGDVPERVETVLLAAEDQDFREHRGVDPQAILRAFAANVRSGDIEQGGSTITQQLAKNLFTGADTSFERKLQELQVAIDIEEHFSKDEILTAYVNSVFLGNRAVGFEAAAHTYFDKSASELTLSETALLVAVIPAPTDRDPRAHPEAAEEARLRVLDRLAESDTVSDAAVSRARAQAPEVQPRRPRNEKFPYYMDYVRRYLLEARQMRPELLYGGGLRIETALDSELQYVARLSVADHLPDGAGPEAAVAVVDVHSGLVAALVGGRKFDGEQVNLALGRAGGGSGRQAGSAFKPFVLTTALEAGRSPEEEIPAPEVYLPETVDDPEPVRNFSQRGYGSVSIREATIRSINTAFVGLTESVGARNVRDTATALGVPRLPDYVGPSIGIGAYEVSPLEMASAYAGFATEGLRVEPGPVERVLGPDGDLVDDFRPPLGTDRPRAISHQTARRVNAILEENVQRGTATRARIDRPAAAKTGTADDYTNAWLVGHTPAYASAVWVGHPEGNVAMRDVAGFSRVTGGSIPALIWKDVMGFASRDAPSVGFTEPPEPPEPDRSGNGEAAAGPP